LTGDYSTVYYRTQTNFVNEILLLSFVGATLVTRAGHGNTRKLIL
jgi:hypothetical protein